MDRAIRCSYLKTAMNLEATPKPVPKTVYFDTELRPHRSLGPTGFAIVMLSASILGFAIGISFMVAGAWPVFGFCGLELILLYVAFRLNYRSGKSYEHIRLTDEGLQIRRYGPKGETGRTDIEPSWLRVTVSETPPNKGHLVLSSHGRSVTVGEFLPPAERHEIAAALRAAIDRYRAPAV